VIATSRPIATEEMTEVGCLRFRSLREDAEPPASATTRPASGAGTSRSLHPVSRRPPRADGHVLTGAIRRARGVRHNH
jgi:hypothetical protein